MEILFCDACDGSISRAELDEGQAVRIGDRIYHRACAPRAGGRRTSLIAWLLLAPALAAGFLVGMLVKPEAPPPPETIDEEALFARLEAVEGQLQGLSAQVATVGQDSAAQGKALGAAIGSRDGALVALGQDLDLLAETVAKLARSLAEPPPPSPEQKEREERLAALLSDLGEGVPFDRRFSAIRALALRPEPQALRAIRTQLDHPDRRIREFALRQLGERGDVDSGLEMISLLQDEDPLVRQAAHRALRLASAMDYPFDFGAPEEVRKKQVLAWLEWWRRREEERDGD